MGGEVLTLLPTNIAAFWYIPSMLHKNLLSSPNRQTKRPTKLQSTQPRDPYRYKIHVVRSLSAIISHLQLPLFVNSFTHHHFCYDLFQYACFPPKPPTRYGLFISCFWPLMQGHTILWSMGTHKSNYISSSNGGTGDLQLNMGSQPQGRAHTIHIYEVSSSAKQKVSLCEHISLAISLRTLSMKTNRSTFLLQCSPLTYD